MKLSSLWGLFKALSWFQAGAGWVAIPVVGPIVGFIFGLVQFLWLAVKTVLKGATSIFQNPYEVAAVGVVALVMLCIGLNWGAKFTAHKLSVLSNQLATVETKLANADETDQARADSAQRARLDAEAQERVRIAAENAAHDPPSPPLGLLSIPTENVAVDSALPAVAAPNAGVRNAKPAPAKGHSGKQKPGMLGGLQDATASALAKAAKAFDTSRW